MIIDSQTNFLYLSDKLKKNKYLPFLDRFESVLKENRIDYDFLENTKDIWAVDYMPIQIDVNKYIQFNYNPGYLQSKKGQASISDVDDICEGIRIKPIKSSIVVDGGNIIKGKNCVIMCDKVFKENESLSETMIINEIKNILEIDKLIFVPWDKTDFLGHSDGMIRFVDSNTVLINDYSQARKEFQLAFQNVLEGAELESIVLPYAVEKNVPFTKAQGIYVNYLQMENIIFSPVFNQREDDLALRIIEDSFKGKKVVPIDCNEIANDGGILNCVTWNILKNN